ncbi:hypothetical protein B9Z19DRAFT_1071504 [Tuber borchii]|uniref:Uncharacterized protein n=1 Tax=Tuber borchii TaxID=42251 RepID=A0A2T7A852_TUBBO|nr:hypothetical protein B9Z19DRAFT_1071504 [Tuber borchii]
MFYISDLYPSTTLPVLLSSPVFKIDMAVAIAVYPSMLFVVVGTIQGVDYPFRR